jgi:hypothetical protein
MKKFLASSLLLAVSAMAESMSGYIIDKNCATKPAMFGNEACAKSCVKKGAPAVFASGGKVYNIDADSKDKVADHVGHKVKIDGKVKGDTISIDSISMDSGT